VEGLYEQADGEPAGFKRRLGTDGMPEASKNTTPRSQSRYYSGAMASEIRRIWIIKSGLSLHNEIHVWPLRCRSVV